MTTPTGNCCEKCRKVMENADILQSERFICTNPSCDCHTPPTDWRERFREKWEKDTKFVGPKIESFIESEIASAIERTRNEIIKNIEDFSDSVIHERRLMSNERAIAKETVRQILAQLSPSQSE